MKRPNNHIWTFISLLVIASMLLAACGGGEEAPTNTPQPEATEAPQPTQAEPTEPPPTTGEFRVGMISDVGGVDDASFNQTTWEGLDRADQEIEGVSAQFLESQSQADYENNITEFAEQGYDMIVTVGFLLGDATAKMAAVYPDIEFAIVDFAYDPPIPNVQGIIFNSDEAAFMGGYLAAGMAVEFDPDDPRVGYVGGMQIPTVEIFFVGFENGIAYYNAEKGTDVQVSGTYVGDFEAPDEGKAAANSLLDEGVDVVFGAGGKTGNGALVAVRERAEAGADVAGIGVDVDQYFTLPQEKGILLTSVEKRLDNAVFNTVKNAAEGNFGGGSAYVGTLENDGVGLAPYHDWEDRIPADLQAEVDALRPMLVAGQISTGWPVGAEEAPVTTGEFRVGMISDVGGVDDASFNQTTWEGLDRADQEIEGVSAQFLESQSQADYENNITEFAEQGYDMIVTVGFLLGEATAKMAAVYPDIEFAIVDFAYDPPIPNVQGIVFDTDEAAFLAGYLAAGMAVQLDPDDPQLGYVGGMQIPTVEIFVVGFESGMAYYNAEKGTDVKLAGTYVGDFEAPDEGKAAGSSLLDEGVDIILGVGGKTGNGALVAVRERAEAGADVAGIGVDVDQYFTLPTEKGVLLTSIEKRLDNAVFNTVKDAVEGNFGGGGVYVGTLANDGVGLSPYHDWEDRIPGELKAEVDTLRPQVMSGAISTGWPVGAEEEPMAELSCPDPIKIGLITDLTGGLAIYGTMTQRSFLLGMEYATGAPGGENNIYNLDGCEIDVLVRDDQGSAETTATLARELIEVEDVDLLVGTVSSGSTATLQEIALENDVALIVAPAAANDITGINFNDHTFRTSRENYQDFINLCQYLTTEYDTFVQIAPDYSFGYGGAQSARDACTFYGGEFVADDIFAPLDTTEFTPYMEQILDSGADAWIVTWAGGGFVPMFQTAAELGILDEMGLGASFFDNGTMVAVFSPVADKMLGQVSGILYHYTAPDNPINDWLVQETEARYGVPPDLFDADGMNAALLAIEAIKASGGDMSAATLIDVMEGMSFEGPKGTIYVRPEDHVAIQDMYIVRLISLDDPDFNIFELVTTTRPEPPCLLPEDLQDRCGDLPIGSLSGQ